LKSSPLKDIKPLPVIIYFGTVFILAIAGIASSVYLTFSHYRVYNDIGYQSFCAISKTINCDTISQSVYAIFLGVPVAVWGIIGYLFIFVIICFSLNKKEKKMRALSTLFVIAFIFSLISLYLGIISSVYINAYCIVCVASWIINFALMYMFWLIRRRYETSSLIVSIKNDFKFWKNKKVTIPILLIFCIMTGSLIFFYPGYWHYTPPKNNIELHTGTTDDGYPWIGAENPELTIVEFSDYLCFQCKKMHFFLRSLVAQHPDKLRIVHRHFPMDHKFNPIVNEPFHSGAGVLSLIAISAIEQNRFWEANDYLYNYDMSNNAIYLREIANDLNIELKVLQESINKEENRLKLSKDIMFGIKQKFSGTPAFMINGQIYIGQIPPKVIQLLGEK